MSMKTVVYMSHCLNCGVGHCLKWELFLSDIGSCLGTVEDGIFGVFINPFIILYLYTSAASGSTGKFQSIQNYQLFSL